MEKNKKSSFGMLSVKAGIDNNPNATQADKIAGAKMKDKTQKANKGKLMSEEEKSKKKAKPEVKEKPIPRMEDLPPKKAINEVPFIKMKDPFTDKDFILDTRPDRPMDILKDIERKKYGGSVGVKMAKGGFKNKTPIY
tara:strand:- start:476 stop:889 length:414 start_codon:yes stop_codon:yes gene_type:complete